MEEAGIGSDLEISEEQRKFVMRAVNRKSYKIQTVSSVRGVGLKKAYIHPIMTNRGITKAAICYNSLVKSTPVLEGAQDAMDQVD